VLAGPAVAADATALAFVTSIYDAYKGKDSKSIPLDNARVVRRYFEPSLAALMIKDHKSAAHRGEIGQLDGDPFIDAQDWNIDEVEIDVTDTAPGKAKAAVKFVNLGKPATVVLDLVKIGKDWRIGDIIWVRDGKPETLRALFSL
jgi:hypothetical protein